MPIYEYRCDACGAKYDIFHKGRENAEDVVCPTCRSTAHTRLISAPSIAMSGGSAPEPSCGPGGCCGGACEMN